MDACPESEVAIGLAIEDAAVRVGELCGVAVGGGVVDDYRFAGAEAVPAQLDVLRDRSGYAVNRSREADELLDGSRQDLGFGDEPVAFVGMRCEIVECERHRACRRFETGLHQKHRIGDDVAERQLLAVDLRVRVVRRSCRPAVVGWCARKPHRGCADRAHPRRPFGLPRSSPFNAVSVNSMHNGTSSMGMPRRYLKKTMPGCRHATSARSPVPCSMKVSISRSVSCGSAAAAPSSARVRSTG